MYIDWAPAFEDIVITPMWFRESSLAFTDFSGLKQLAVIVEGYEDDYNITKLRIGSQKMDIAMDKALQRVRKMVARLNPGVEVTLEFRTIDWGERWSDVYESESECYESD